MNARCTQTWLVGMMVAVATWGSTSLAESPDGAKSAYDSDPSGWIELMPKADLQGWKRVPIAPTTSLTLKNPWSYDASTKSLMCDGDEVKEIFLCDQAFEDGIFHIECRFQKRDGNPLYNSGAYVRTTGGDRWHQVQIAHIEKTPFMGAIFGDRPKDGALERWIVEGKGREFAHPPGEWNTFEIECRGKSIVVSINGHVATRWDDCPVPRGSVGLQAEYFDIEFRRLVFKELKK